MSILDTKPNADENALLTSIRMDPDALGPRLVYADWLQQRGETLGEYISLNISLGRVPADDPSRQAMLDRLKEIGLPAVWQKPWFHDVAWTTELGLPSRLSLRKLDISDALIISLERTMVRELHITQGGLVEDQLPMISAILPKMRLRAISINEWIPINVLGVLLASRDEATSTSVRADLESLSLGSAHLNDDVLTLLATTPFARLNRLAVDGFATNLSAATDAGAHRLASSAFLKQVRDLSLRRHSLTASGLSELLSGKLPLTAIHLSGNPLGAAGVRAIVESPRAAHLDTLSIADCQLDREALEILANAKAFRGLKRLRLADDAGVLCESKLTPDLLSVLVASPVLPKMLELEIDGSALGLEADIHIDGMDGQPCWSSWKGEIPEAIKNRFQVKLVGQPSY